MIRAIFLAGVILIVICGMLLWYLNRRAERAEARRKRKERQRMREREMEHEEQMQLFENEEL